MSMLERRINFIIAKNPKLIKSLDRNKNHPLIRKYSHIKMNITNITDDYDNITEYDNTTDTNNCNIDIIIPALLITIPCGISFLCLISLMVYTLVKPLINRK